MKIKKIIIIILTILMSIQFLSCGNKPLSNRDTDFTRQWGLENDGDLKLLQDDFRGALVIQPKEDIDIDYQEMWESLPSSFPQKDVVIAVIDSGIDFSCDELKNSRWENRDEIPDNKIDDDKNGYVDDTYGWDFIRNFANLESDESYVEARHGTTCAGIIAADNNETGIVGVTRGKGIKLMDLKVLDERDSYGEGSIRSIIAAIDYAEKNGASICNLSLSTDIYSESLYSKMRSSKMMFVASSGNSTGLIRTNIDKKNEYPACFGLPNLIAVTNIDCNGDLHWGANIGNKSIQIAAPGTNIYSTNPGGSFDYSTGSSFAAPFVTGVAAVLYQYLEYPTAQRVIRIICDSATKLESLEGKVSTGGMLNGTAAMTLARIEEEDFNK